MNKRKKNILYAIVTMVALGALGVDMLTRESAPSATDSEPQVTPVVSSIDPAGHASSAARSTSAECTGAVARQLAAAAKAHRVDVANVADAFAFGQMWQPDKPNFVQAVVPNGEPKPVPLPDLQLTGTMVSGGRRVAIINGHVLRVGDEIAGWQIKAVEPRAVVLRRQETETRLTLKEPALGDISGAIGQKRITVP
jgi:hypothetical protein